MKNDAGWTAQEILAVLAREGFEAFVTGIICGAAVTIVGGLLLAYWPCRRD